ncbi:MAG TPA: hypothetical protein VFL62_12720 [Bradyrhizobium sp.]|uniref:hypothetical protein n=1 Tax=Bradyrhizobium sp. TaxID=376 RepID=UPI002D7EE69D|nr:hypothetical protein [Bradyrhizobium sp.]HET7887083.1 hypothetical protein [Bradyrhizobium sp.]
MQQFLQQESNNSRTADALAIVGHSVIALILLLGFFGQTEPALEAAIPVEIVMEEPAAASPPPVSTPNEQSVLPAIPAVADTDKHAKAPRAERNVNGVDQPKQPGHDGGDPSPDPAGQATPSAAGDLASGAASLPSWTIQPIGPAQQQAMAREPGEDELTAIKEPKLGCGAKAKWLSPRTGTRKQAVVIGIATPAQAQAMTRSSQVLADRRVSPNYATGMAAFAETWEGKTGIVLGTGLNVNVGDVIEFDEGHIDPSDPCQYIPNFAVSKH